MSTQGSGQPAGWYYAAGDPPGTHRYWDGTQWQGAPQPVAAAPQVAATSSAPLPAGLGPRFIAYIIDSLAIMAVFIAVIIVTVIFFTVSDVLGRLALLVGLVGYVAFGFYNMVYLVGKTGQSIGKKQQGIKVVDDASGQPIGVGMAFVRAFIAGIISIVDLIFILVDEENKRITDKILNCNVVQA